jgi:hypothetical protein
VFHLRKGLVITGRVLTEQGEPIAGAKLLLGESRFVSNPTQARTDERGEFRLAGVNLGSTYLTVQANGCSPESRPITVEAKMEPVEFKLRPGHVFKAKVVDEAGRPIRTVRVTVANIAPVAVVPVAAPAPVAPLAAAPTPARPAPHAPTKLSVVVPRARHGAAPVPVALHWRNPVGVDLDRVVVVLNHARPPRTPADGSIVYRGLGTATTLKLRPARGGFVALFAVDRSGQVSHAARRIVSLARAALRPLSGSVVSKRPRLSWRARRHTAYYNLQVFHKGKRILVRWPARATYRIPAGRLEPGTYVGTWPALSTGAQRRPSAS